MATKNTATVNTKETKKEEGTMKKEVVKKEVKKVEKKAPAKKQEVAKVEKKVETKKVENKKKVNTAVPQLTNDQMKELFNANGCATYTKASNESKVVYNTFGTKSRVLQQGKAYQLLLTNGHENKKGAIINTENDDTARFIQWYGGLTDEQKGWVVGIQEIDKTKLAASEMPRERTVKITNLDLLVAYIKYMATFAENQIAK